MDTNSESTDTKSAPVQHAEKATSWRHALDLAATVLMILAAVAILATTKLDIFGLAGPARRTPAELSIPKDPQSLVGAAIKGGSAAKVAVIIYSDFQCPFCRVLAQQVLPSFERDYVDSGKVLLAFRHLPLLQIHPFAFGAAQAAECARQQGKFWEMHDLLFGDQEHLTEPQLKEYAAKLGLDMSRYGSCAAGSGRAAVDADGMQALALGLSSTPSLFVGVIQPDGLVVVRKGLKGVQSQAQLVSTVTDLLSAAEK